MPLPLRHILAAATSWSRITDCRQASRKPASIHHSLREASSSMCSGLALKRNAVEGAMEVQACMAHCQADSGGVCKPERPRKARGIPSWLQPHAAVRELR